MNKAKIINDPVYGFIKIPTPLLYDLIAHPFFQRLRRIRQLGLAEFVYPGAIHTRFHHALGAMHLMGVTLETLRTKHIDISPQEMEAAQIAILLHDIGHGPMSHALEYSLLDNIDHEQISLLFMKALNQEFSQALSLAIAMFEGKYHRKFFQQLISSQLDIDRMDYLQRDCFFTGVSEGAIGADRIIKMLTVANDELVVEEKGIYSIENFLTARRLMYWQVYLHKTNLCADKMLTATLARLRQLLKQNIEIEIPHALEPFLKNIHSQNDFTQNPQLLQHFANIDDTDIWQGLKMWQHQKQDAVLATLAKRILERKLYSTFISAEKPEKDYIKSIKKEIISKFGIRKEDIDFFILQGSISNEAYLAKKDTINIINKKGQIQDIAQASDLPNIKALRKIVKKYYLCYINY
ncbi:MAG: HD domain-containing protein [Cytophagales bacterium]|nr:MAG: HD domain-containing protein [Cytophagales bacterium]